MAITIFTHVGDVPSMRRCSRRVAGLPEDLLRVSLNHAHVAKFVLHGYGSTGLLTFSIFTFHVMMTPRDWQLTVPGKLRG